jgi:hypothetical protein
MYPCHMSVYVCYYNVTWVKENKLFYSILFYCQEVDSRKVKDLEDTVRLKNKQIHQLLEDVDQVEQDNTSKTK